MRRMLGKGLLAVLAAAASCAAASEAEHHVAIAGYKYSPAEIRIKPGDTVVWTNGEKRTSHSILFKATGEESERLFPGETWSKVFPHAGRYDYTCGPHPEMLGVVIVGE